MTPNKSLQRRHNQEMCTICYKSYYILRSKHFEISKVQNTELRIPFFRLSNTQSSAADQSDWLAKLEPSKRSLFKLLHQSFLTYTQVPPQAFHPMLVLPGQLPRRRLTWVVQSSYPPSLSFLWKSNPRDFKNVI